jgi:hypothetical protein
MDDSDRTESREPLVTIPEHLVFAQAQITRGRVAYAIGTSVSTRAGRSVLALVELRTLVRGSYTLSLRRWSRGRWIAHDVTMAIA